MERERFAPSFHVAEYSVNPRTWCRYPILSGDPLAIVAINQSQKRTKEPK